MAKKVKAKTIEVAEFTKIFPDEDAAMAYFESIRWDQTLTCPRCNQSDKIGAGRHLEAVGYGRQAVNHSAKQYVDGMAHTNGVESVWAVLKRGYYGTYHNWSMKHIRRYVNEFTFRLNEGDVQRDTLDRIASLSQALCGKRLRYRELVA